MNGLNSLMSKGDVLANYNVNVCVVNLPHCLISLWFVARCLFGSILRLVGSNCNSCAVFPLPDLQELG